MLTATGAMVSPSQAGAATDQYCPSRQGTPGHQAGLGRGRGSGPVRLQGDIQGWIPISFSERLVRCQQRPLGPVPGTQSCLRSQCLFLWGLGELPPPWIFHRDGGSTVLSCTPGSFSQGSRRVKEKTSTDWRRSPEVLWGL